MNEWLTRNNNYRLYCLFNLDTSLIMSFIILPVEWEEDHRVQYPTIDCGSWGLLLYTWIALYPLLVLVLWVNCIDRMSSLVCQRMKWVRWSIRVQYYCYYYYCCCHCDCYCYCYSYYYCYFQQQLERFRVLPCILSGNNYDKHHIYSSCSDKNCT